MSQPKIKPLLPTEIPHQSLEDAQQIICTVIENVERVIRGKKNVICQALTAWLGGGHVLFEDAPGTGKTVLARAIARSVSVSTKRIQFTPDLLPTDITGTSMISKKSSVLEFTPGPVFTNVLLADEINRATPRTQSALLEAMAERQVTVENQTFALPENFFVIATQNPVEQHGTFPLPEAQLDRFMMRLSLGYPEKEDEKKVIQMQLLGHPLDSLNPIIDEETWNGVRSLVKRIKVSDAALGYALSLVHATRKIPEVSLGCSPRATISIIRCAQAMAAMLGQDFVEPDFIKVLAPTVLEHRIVLATKARLENVSETEIIRDIIKKIPVPTGV